MARNMLVVTHPGRPDALEAAHSVIRALQASGVTAVVARAQAPAISEGLENPPEVVDGGEGLSDIELGIVLGGDGTILLAAELLRGSGAPLLGVNLGHVGFLAESEKDDLGVTIEQVLAQNYDVDERLALDVVVTHGSDELFRTFALTRRPSRKPIVLAWSKLP